MLSESAIKATYKRAGLTPVNTFLWDEMTDQIKDNVVNKLNIDNYEKFIICYLKNENYFLLYSNYRLIIFDEAEATFIPYRTIKRAELPIINSGNDKMEIDKLDITLRNGNVITIRIEKNTWHFFYGLFKFLI